MANGVLIIGETGSGKSTAIRTLDPKETFIINVSGKPLSFKGWKSLYKPFSSSTKDGNYVKIHDALQVLKVMEIVNGLPHIKSLIVEDFNYISSFELMSKINESGYGKFNSIAKHIFDLVIKYRDLRDDLTVFYTNHPEITQNIDGEERFKARTAGKMIDQQIVLEGLFTVVLFAKVKRSGKESNYFFETQSDGKTPSKSPMGMFESFEIPNDMEFVRQSIISYNE